MNKNINMKTLINIAIVAIASVCMVSCFNDNKPNYQYFPNMYAPVGYEAYGSYNTEYFENGQEAMTPPPGTIPRGWQPYDYENTTAGLELARVELQNPLEINDENLAAGNQLYTIYCAVCHGDKGDGKGILAQREKFLGIPSYADPGRNITPGGIYHVEMYGLNSMGSYASQTNEKERWQIAMHVMNLKAALNGQPGLLGNPTDSTAVDSTKMAQPIVVDSTATANVERN
ncbi:c-type cytochrome [Aequorivita echinoideorum]|uniref:C-type cytochrome n=1 Tax=Aequorivita echinoideorum TaxID=1549647 RepID=A0ABS5S5N5_9FLAO|nr:cytochrome c [Aequorivita echinoideorum]MBT0607725.1 c-type cytochrome [Aequorivita echinoideorum]